MKRQWTVPDLPLGEKGPWTITREKPSKLAQMLEGVPGRMLTLARKDGHIWMSDTPDEKGWHYDALNRTGRILVNGLGLGCITNWLLQDPAVESVDVVEIDDDLAALVGPHYEDKWGDRFRLHIGDAFDFPWPKGTTFDYVWTDIWPNICVDNLDEMNRLRRSYSKRGIVKADQHGCWSRDECLYQRRRDKDAWWNK